MCHISPWCFAPGIIEIDDFVAENMGIVITDNELVSH